MEFMLDWGEYAARARAMVAEGCVLLRNEDKTLPLRKNDRVSIFGRAQFEYYKSGTGSGGMVNAAYSVSIPEGLSKQGIVLNEKLAGKYHAYIEENPFDKGKGWAQEPFSQIEMPLDDETVRQAALESDIAIIIIGRSAGEDRDTSTEKGSFLLSDEEENEISIVTKYFSRTAVLLNVGNIIDMKWVDEYRPGAVMYVWQGGQEGGNGVADVLTGAVNPSGHLADTIAGDIADYPSTENFGDPDRNFYTEDVYVGYRYFETFARDKVLYPFGFGLSYTGFEMEPVGFDAPGKEIRVRVKVTNTGDTAGKQAVQIYVKPPQVRIAKPFRNLVSFGKTNVMDPAESQTLTFVFPVEDMASFDDTGATGGTSSFVLEPGCYKVYAGFDVRSAKFVGKHMQEQLRVTEKCTQACAPAIGFRRLTAGGDPDNDTAKAEYEDVTVAKTNLKKRIEDNRPESRECKGDQGIRLVDVRDGGHKMDEFVDQLSDDELIWLTRGEGMCSPKVTPGVAAAFGGVTEELKHYGIPVGSCSDGPSGIRMDSGAMAFSNPSGTLIACSFNTMLTSRLFEYQGRELRMNRIDTLLGPGINIHRNPLNGRNFEYFSEDPYLTGMMASAELLAMHRSGTTGTIKHFACNSQETKRNHADPVVSERALREIYLKPFEMAVKKGGAYCIMTTYGPLNGIWTAGNYDLNTTILRGEWHYTGIVMTDWWASMSDDDGNVDRSHTTEMVRAQNDVYMVTDDSKSNSSGDDTAEGLAEGRITRGELLRNASNICRVLMNMPAMEFFLGNNDEIEEKGRPSTDDEKCLSQPSAEEKDGCCRLDVSGLVTEGGTSDIYCVTIPDHGIYKLSMDISSDLSKIAQISVSVYVNNTIKGSFTANGTEGKVIRKEIEFDSTMQTDNYIKIYFAQSGLKVHSAEVRLKE